MQNKRYLILGFCLKNAKYKIFRYRISRQNAKYKIFRYRISRQMYERTHSDFIKSHQHATIAIF